MCAITGFWEKTLSSQPQYILKEMTQTMHHRGPDGYGFHSEESDSPHMGHARLSIIGLETGGQPLYNADRSLIATVNGEFYDYKKIRTELALAGYSFQTKSDSEIILALYEHYGMRFIDHLRGEFAFAIYDVKARKLILGRDRFGIRPLFYHHSEHGFYYGSEIKALLAHPMVPNNISHKAMLHQLIQVMIPGMTLFEGIHALKPGHLMVIGENNDNSFDIEEQAYWDFNYPLQGQHDYHKSSDEHLHDVQSTLTEAIALRLEADVPVACYLSGGIDSCSILGLATNMQQSKIKAFTIGFGETDFDEADIAKDMSRKCQAEHDILNLHSKDLYGDNYIKTLWHSERTFYNTLGVSKYLMSQHVTNHNYRVVLTGEGSDEIFGGYISFKKDMLIHASENATSSLNTLDQNNSLFKGSVIPDDVVSHPELDRLWGFTPTWIQPWIQTWQKITPLLSESFRQNLGSYDPFAALASSLDINQINGRHPLDVAQYTWSKTMLEGQILNWGGDRVDMANSLESRPPFLDHHLVELATKIPPELRIKDGTEKWILREAMKNILPKSLYEREKFSFMAPPAFSKSREEQQGLWDLISQHLTIEKVEDLGFIDYQQLLALLDECQNSQDNAALFRNDIILNHLIGLHALKELLASDLTKQEIDELSA